MLGSESSRYRHAGPRDERGHVLHTVHTTSPLGRGAHGVLGPFGILSPSHPYLDSNISASVAHLSTSNILLFGVRIFVCGNLHLIAVTSSLWHPRMPFELGRRPYRFKRIECTCWHGCAAHYDCSKFDGPSVANLSDPLAVFRDAVNFVLDDLDVST